MLLVQQARPLGKLLFKEAKGQPTKGKEAYTKDPRNRKEGLIANQGKLGNEHIN